MPILLETATQCMTCTWRIDDLDRDQVALELGVSRLAASVYLQRGIHNKADLDRVKDYRVSRLFPFALMPDAEVALKRLCRAIKRREKIYVWGDYDADGITAAAVMSIGLTAVGADFVCGLPDRFRDGYDLSANVIDYAKSQNAKLIVTVDCGIRAIEAAEVAKQASIDLIITDHHQPDPTGRLPQCVAVVNPNRLDSDYPFGGLAGVGIAQKLVVALAERLGKDSRQVFRDTIGLVAIGTVADVAEMRSENRILVYHGCRSLSRTLKPGLRSLLTSAGVTDVDETAIGWKIGPRLNAVGRLGDPMDALRLLLAQDELTASQLGTAIDKANRLRKEIQVQAMTGAQAMIDAAGDGPSANVLWSASWHPGVIGLVAGDLARATGKPTFIISIGEDGIARGSCRSVGDLNIMAVLESPACRPLFSRLGGHHQAAGFSMLEENLPELHRRICAEVSLCCFDSKPMQEVADVEAQLGDFTVQAYEEICQLAPFGSGFEPPKFLITDAAFVRSWSLAGKGKAYRLKGSGTGSSSIKMKDWRSLAETVGWRAGRKAQAICEFGLNVYRGVVSPELNLVAISEPRERND